MAHKRTINLDDYYDCAQAVARLSENAGRPVDKNYPRTLVAYKKVRSEHFGGGTLYLKADIDAYVVSSKRGPRKAIADQKG